jgi:hypothetical protein
MKSVFKSLKKENGNEQLESARNSDKMKNKHLMFWILSSIILTACKSYEKKIIGTWYYIESTDELISNDSLIQLISRQPNIVKEYKYLSSCTFHPDKTFDYHNTDYKNHGTYKVKGDTLIFNSFETNVSKICRIDKNVLVEYRGGHFPTYYYSVNHLEKKRMSKEVKIRF